MKTQILVIEDVPDMSQLICLYMTNAGFETTACEKAEDALKKIEDGYIPDLILLDLNLPGMSGFEFLKKFRASYKPTIPVMIVSARDADDDIIEALGNGADERDDEVRSIYTFLPQLCSYKRFREDRTFNKRI